jgi:hypothetical protein
MRRLSWLLVLMPVEAWDESPARRVLSLLNRHLAPSGGRIRQPVWEVLLAPVLGVAEAMQEGFRRQVLEMGVGPRGPLHVMHLMSTFEDEARALLDQGGEQVARVADKVLEGGEEQRREAEEHRRARRRAARSTWIGLLETLATERGPWGSSRGMEVCWTLDDDVVDVLRRRVKLRRNEQGSRHEAITANQEGQGARPRASSSTSTASSVSSLPGEGPLPAAAGMWAELLKYQKAVNARVSVLHLSSTWLHVLIPYVEADNVAV